MGSNNDQNKNLQDKQAGPLDQTYTLDWVDGCSEGYDDIISDSQNALDKSGNENGLLDGIIGNKDNVIDEMTSSVGKTLQIVKKDK